MTPEYLSYLHYLRLNADYFEASGQPHLAKWLRGLIERAGRDNGN
jgi:hypothetical protein